MTEHEPYRKGPEPHKVVYLLVELVNTIFSQTIGREVGYALVELTGDAPQMLLFIRNTVTRIRPRYGIPVAGRKNVVEVRAEWFDCEETGGQVHWFVLPERARDIFEALLRVHARCHPDF